MTLNNKNQSQQGAFNQAHGELKEQGFNTDYLITSWANFATLVDDLGGKCQYQLVVVDGVEFRSLFCSGASGAYNVIPDHTITDNTVVAFGTNIHNKSILAALRADKDLTEKN